ncbi:MAG: glycosyltransferase [Candidatus Omnitrophica bacterium]|nr:glycosyltransferase [Candidatus Omnitrophota bacterium]
MPRVLFIAAEPDIKGGGERFLVELMDGLLARHDFDLACVCPADGDLAEHFCRKGVKVFIACCGWNRKWKSIFPNYWRLMRLWLLARAFKPDLIYANAGHLNSFSVKLGRLLGVVVLTHVHDVFDASGSDKFLFKQADGVAACSQGVASLVKKYRPQVFVVPNGVDVNRFVFFDNAIRAQARRSLNIPVNAFVVGYVGTLVEKKGIFDFLKFAGQVSLNVPEAWFIMAGTPKPGQEGIVKELQQRAEALGMAKRLIMPGFVDAPEKILSAMDCFLFPGHYEAFGRVIIEAMAVGAVVVATRCGGPEEIVRDGETGFLAAVSDIDNMSQAVVRLAQDSRLKDRIRMAAREFVVENFSLTASVNKAVAVIKTLLETRKA